jgi:DHA2 family methylenomycin A resistance protein-like MFS transporter
MRKHIPSKWLTLIAACFGLLMLYIDLFIVNVALPAIGHDFRVSLSTVSWTISGYVLMIGVLPMGFGRLGDIWGQRALYLAGLVLFSCASLACGLAPNITALIAFRVVQGIGAAIMTPGTLAIIIRAFPPRQHGLAIGIYGGISGLGLIAGPLLGGLLVQGEGWRWIFFVNVPLGIVALIMAVLFVPEARDAIDPAPVDWRGLLFLSTGLLFLLYGFTRAGDEGWTSMVVIGSCLAGIIILTLFVITERRVRWPLIDLALFRNLPFVMGCLSFFLFSAALFGSQPYWSLFMQNTWGFSPLQGGLAFLPATILIVLFTPLTGLLAQWAGSRLYVFVVCGVLAIGLSFLSLVILLTPQSTYVDGLLPALLVRGLAIPVVSSSATLAVISAVSKKQSGLASGTLGMARNIGTAFGVAILSQVYLFHIDVTLPQSLSVYRGAAEQFIVAGKGADHAVIEAIILQGFKLTGLVSAIFCAFAVVIALFMRTRSHPNQVSRQEEVQEEIKEELLYVAPDKRVL